MTWIVFGILCAFGEALKDVSARHGLQKLDPLLLSWIFFAGTSLVCLPVLFFIEIPEIGYDYFGWLLLHGLLYGVSVLIYMKAISSGKLTETVPLIMLTPVFILLEGAIVLGEFPDVLGSIGIFLIVCGTYILKLGSHERDYLKPLKLVFTNKGSRLMLLVAAIWSVTSVIDKLGILSSSPIFWGVTLYIFVAAYLTLIVIATKKLSCSLIRTNFKTVAAVSVFNSIQMISYVIAFSSGLVVYVLAVKRLSVFLIVAIESVIDGNDQLKQHLFACGMMFIGVLLIMF